MLQPASIKCEFTKVGILSGVKKEKLFGPKRDSMPVFYLFHVYCNEF